MMTRCPMARSHHLGSRNLNGSNGGTLTGGVVNVRVFGSDVGMLHVGVANARVSGTDVGILLAGVANVRVSGSDGGMVSACASETSPLSI